MVSARPPTEQLELRPFERGMAGSERAARRWTPAQVRDVDKAIRDCARFRETFTTDDVWAEVRSSDPDFPITKGIGGRLNAARHAGLIENTGQTTIARRGGQHDHAQRLSVWRAL